MTFLFDRETALVALGEGQFSIMVSDIYQNPNGSPFGGWVAAITAKAVEQHEECRSPVVSLQSTFLAGAGSGDVMISVRLLKSGASTQFWRVEINQNDLPVAVSDVVTSNRKPIDLDYQLEMPSTKLPKDSKLLVQRSETAPLWFGAYEQRIVKGTPFTNNVIPESLVWIKETDDRPIDRASIVSICDAPMPRSFYLSERPHVGSTVSMSTCIYASEDDIAAAGSDYLLLRVNGATVRNSVGDQRAELWSANGTLLATSNQINFMRQMRVGD